MLLFLPETDCGLEWKLSQMAVTAPSPVWQPGEGHTSHLPHPLVDDTVEHPRVSEYLAVTAGLGQCLMKVTYQIHS